MHESQEGLEAIGEFFQQFGAPDVYTLVLMEILFQELMNISDEEADGQNN